MARSRYLLDLVVCRRMLLCTVDATILSGSCGNDMFMNDGSTYQTRYLLPSLRFCHSRIPRGDGDTHLRCDFVLFPIRYHLLCRAGCDGTTMHWSCRIRAQADTHAETLRSDPLGCLGRPAHPDEGETVRGIALTSLAAYLLLHDRSNHEKLPSERNPCAAIIGTPHWLTLTCAGA